MSDYAFTNNTLFVTIIQCKRVKHFYYIFFFQEKQMCDRGCGKVLKGSKLGKVFSRLKENGMCEESRSQVCALILPASCRVVLGDTS